MSRWIYLAPITGFALLAFFLFKSLWSPAPDVIPSALIDKPAPRLDLPALDAQARGFNRADLAAGHVSVINFFASWCVPCRLEADTLIVLSRQPGFKLYGIAYKDKRADTRQFLSETGDPFAAIVADDKGDRAIDWGVSAAPETFVVDRHGIVRFKYVGGLSGAVIASQLMPAIKAAQDN